MLYLWTHPNGKIYIRGAPEKGAKPLFKGTGFTREQEDEAQDCLEKKRAELRTERIFGKKATVGFAEAMHAYIENGGSTRFLDKLLEHFKDTPLHKIGQHEIDKAAATVFVDKATGKTKKVSPATRNRQVFTPMSAILRYAARKKWCDPLDLERPKVPKREDRWLTPDEAERLIEACAKHMKPLVVFLLYTGARAGEALYLDWRNVDLDRAQVTFVRTKTDTPRSVPLHSRVVAELTALKHRKGEVFLTPAGTPYARPKGEDTSAGSKIHTGFSRACERAGIVNFRVHDCRHTWASWMMQAGVSLSDLQKLGGWKTPSMVFQYSHANVASHAASIERLPRVNSVKPVQEVA